MITRGPCSITATRRTKINDSGQITTRQVKRQGKTPRRKSVADMAWCEHCEGGTPSITHRIGTVCAYCGYLRARRRPPRLDGPPRREYPGSPR